MSTTAHDASGKYISVNGINLYYEVHGTGEPLVMLHGGFGSFEMFDALSPLLAQHHQVIGVDLYGHGRTALTDRLPSFEDMADDIAGLIEHLGYAKADVLGYSLGGAVALQFAFRHPEQIHRLILASAPYQRSAWYPDIQAGMAATIPEFFLETPVYANYRRLAPRPEDFTRFVQITVKMLSQDYDWTESVAALKCPTLLLVGDADSFQLTHAVEFFRLLGGGLRDGGWNGEHLVASQLAILPGVTHYDIVTHTDLLSPILSAFLKRKH